MFRLIAIFLSVTIFPLELKSEELRLDFKKAELGKFPKGFSTSLLGKGDPANWQITETHQPRHQLLRLILEIKIWQPVAHFLKRPAAPSGAVLLFVFLKIMNLETSHILFELESMVALSDKLQELFSALKMKKISIPFLLTL